MRLIIFPDTAEENPVNLAILTNKANNAMVSIDGRMPRDLAASDPKARWPAGTGRKELHALFVGLDSHGALCVDPALPHTPTKRPLMTAKACR